MADFYTDIHSIQHAVHQSRSKDEAKDRFYNMHGISLTRNQAELAYKDAMKKRFPAEKQQTQAAYREQIRAKYILVEGILDTQTIKKTVLDLKKNKKFEELKQYYNTIKQDLIKQFSLSSDEASSVINYAIHH